ncbi:MAG: four helix bundle protein [Bacteroidetes bacterium]|nr:four helix bundle protein [Bacteroidota bacterium]
MASTNFKNTSAFVKGFALAMFIFEKTKEFPQEEKYALTDQIRRSSRSVCANLAEAFRKKIYPAHFISKITDADAENSETQVWLDFAFRCNYLQKSEYEYLLNQSTEIGKLLSHMISHPDRY